MRIKIIALFILCTSFIVNAQQYSTSPYSAYGIGEIGGLDHSYYGSMGGSSTSIVDSFTVNYYNPASYAFLGFGQPVFSTGISAKFSTYSANGTSANSKFFGIDHFALAVPFHKRLALSFGLKPFSKSGYNFIQDQVLTDGTNIRHDYKGFGTTNEAFFGFAGKILDLPNHKIGLGANAGYLFGSINNAKYAYIYSPTAIKYAGGIENQGIALKTFHYNLGLIYTYKINAKNSLNIGATIAPEQQLNGRLNNYFAYSGTDVYNFTEYKLLSEDYSKGSISMPSELTFGASYTLTDLSVKDGKNKGQLLLSLEYKTTDYTNYSESIAATNSTADFGQYTHYGFGVQYIPHYNYIERASANKYISKIRYRAGIQYVQLPLRINGDQTNELKYAVGFGFPLAMQRSASSINIGFSYGSRDNASSALKENFWGINLGVSIAPGFSDRWFRKFKID